MSEVLAQRPSHLRLVASHADDADDRSLIASVRLLSPQNRRILAAAIAKANQVDSDEGEEAACALIEKVIAVLRRS